MRSAGAHGNVGGMPITARATTTRRLSRLRPRGGWAPHVGWLEIAVAVTLLGSLLTIRWPWAHLSFGGTFTVLAAIHVARRRRIYRAILRRSWRRAIVSSLLVGSAIAMAVSGVVQWPGVPAAIPWHGATSMLLLLMAIGHGARRLPARSTPAVAGALPIPFSTRQRLTRFTRQGLSANGDDRSVLLAPTDRDLGSSRLGAHLDRASSAWREIPAHGRR